MEGAIPADDDERMVFAARLFGSLLAFFGGGRENDIHLVEGAMQATNDSILVSGELAMPRLIGEKKQRVLHRIYFKRNARERVGERKKAKEEVVPGLFELRR